MSTLEARHIEKAFGRTHALRGVSATIEPGEIVAITGYQSSRLASADRERRLSALRLAGATPAQVRLLGALETTRAAVLGTVAGAATYLLLQWGGRTLLLDSRSHADVNVPPALCAAAPVCTVAALAGVILPGAVTLGAVARFGAWCLYPFPRAALLAGLGVLVAVLAAFSSRRRLRRTATPVLLRAE